MTKQQLQQFLDAILPTDQDLDNAKEEVKNSDEVYNTWLVTGFCVCVIGIREKAKKLIEKYE